MRKKSGSRSIVAVLTLIAVGLAGLGYFVHAYFQVQHVRVEGNALYTGPYIAAIADVPNGAHMLEIDEDGIRSRIEKAEPYLRVTSVHRELPSTVVVGVAERSPAALLPYSDQYVLTDAGGIALETLLDPAQATVPTVTGISINDVEVGNVVETDDEFKLAVMVDLLQELKARRLFGLIKTVDLSNINNIQLISANGLPIRFGQAEKISDKVKWIANRLPALELANQRDGSLDVSAGSFASYTILEGDNSGDPESAASPTFTPSSAVDDAERSE